MFQKIPKNVIVLGIVSFFNDVSSEMVYPIIPLFLTSVLGAPVAVVGLIEGIAEATASIMKFVFGVLSDRYQKRKVFVVFGYSFTGISKLLIGIASSWYFVLFARFIDRFGKGLRTSARDSILLQNATNENKGFIFGFHRALDSLGAVVGPLLALLLLALLHGNMRLIFLIAFIPAVVSIFCLIWFVTEKKHESSQSGTKHFSLRLKNLNPHFLFFFIVSMFFAAGNSSDAFLILRAKNLGLTTTATVFAYVLYNISQTFFATPAGKLSDRIGAKRVFSGGLLVFAFVYFLFGVIHSPILLWFLFPFYGIYIAATDGVSKAYIATYITEVESGTYFGLYQMGTALLSFFASLIGGILWTAINPSATFFYGAAMAGIAFFLFLIGSVRKQV